MTTQLGPHRHARPGQPPFASTAASWAATSHGRWVTSAQLYRSVVNPSAAAALSRRMSCQRRSAGWDSCLAGLVASLITKVKVNGWPAILKISIPLTAGVANTPVAAYLTSGAAPRSATAKQHSAADARAVDWILRMGNIVTALLFCGDANLSQNRLGNGS